jgi:glycosyltransferase involved in cell wall biosynthesis
MEREPPLISIVSPVFQASQIVSELVRRLSVGVQNITDRYEIVLVDDGSSDGVWDEIVRIGAQDQHVKGIKLSRNFGQHRAITAGLEYARGDYVVVIDCDLQDDPNDIKKLYDKALEGFDIVYTRRATRKFSVSKNIFATLFSCIFNWLTGDSAIKTSLNVGTFSLISRRVVEPYLQVDDKHRHYLFILRWLGFNSAYVDVQHHPRLQGKSSYTVAKLLRHAIDGIVSQSDRLLHLSVLLGFTFCIGAFIGIILLVLLFLLHGFKEGWTSVMVVVLFSTGLILLSLGIIGIYIGKIFDEVRTRPLFIVDKVINIENIHSPYNGMRK